MNQKQIIIAALIIVAIILIVWAVQKFGKNAKKENSNTDSNTDSGTPTTTPRPSTISTPVPSVERTMRTGGIPSSGGQRVQIGNVVR